MNHSHREVPSPPLPLLEREGECHPYTNGSAGSSGSEPSVSGGRSECLRGLLCPACRKCLEKPVGLHVLITDKV
jgi:hypothetical protein